MNKVNCAQCGKELSTAHIDNTINILGHELRSKQEIIRKMYDLIKHEVKKTQMEV